MSEQALFNPSLENQPLDDQLYGGANEAAHVNPDNLQFYADPSVMQSIGQTIGEINANDSIDLASKSSAIEIMEHGTYRGSEAGFNEVIRNTHQEVEEREYLATLFIRDPETAKQVVEAGVGGFHATRSQALAGVLESGALQSAASLRKNGDALVTGEHYYQTAEGQKSISFSNFTRTRDIAGTYAGEAGVKKRDTDTVLEELKSQIDGLQRFASETPGMSDKLEAIAEGHKVAYDKISNDPNSLLGTLSRFNFPVLFGVNKDYVRQSEVNRTGGHLLTGASELGEFRPATEKIDLLHLPVIAVPSEVVGSVAALMKEFGHDTTKIVPIESLAA